MAAYVLEAVTFWTFEVAEIGRAARRMLSSPWDGNDNKAIMADGSTGLVSGARRLSPDALDARVRRIATGLAALGVAPGQCVAILMRNDIAFMEAAYAAQTLGAYAVPINWHFKAEEIAYILTDCGTRVLIGHADLLASSCPAPCSFFQWKSFSTRNAARPIFRGRRCPESCPL